MGRTKIGRGRFLALLSLPVFLALWGFITFFILADRPLLDRLLPQAVGVVMILLLRALLRVIVS